MQIERYTGDPAASSRPPIRARCPPAWCGTCSAGRTSTTGIRRLADGSIQAQKPGGWGKSVHAERLVAVVSVNELNRQGKPHRTGYIGRFRYSDVRIDDEGIRLCLEEQVAGAVNVPKSGKPKARRGRGSY
jgi:hypothetical protein